MKWEGFDAEPDLAGFSSKSGSVEHNEEVGRENTTSQCQWLSSVFPFAWTSTTTQKQEDIGLNETSERTSEFASSRFQCCEDDLPSSPTSLDRAIGKRRNSHEMSSRLVFSNLGYDEIVLSDNPAHHHHQPFVTRERSRSLTPRYSSLQRQSQTKSFNLGYDATKKLYAMCEVHHAKVGVNHVTMVRIFQSRVKYG